MQEADPRDARPTRRDRVAQQGVDRAVAHPSFGKGPTQDFDRIAGLVLDDPRLPLPPAAEEFEALDLVRQSWQRLDVMIPRHGEHPDLGVEQSMHRGLERSQGLEASIGTLDDVTREENRVDTFLDRALDGGFESRLGREGPRIHPLAIESVGQASGARTQMDIANGEEREAVGVGT